MQTVNTAAHPMVKLQIKLRSLVKSGAVEPSDRIGKIALLYGNDWSFWKQELDDFGFSLQDPIADVLAVETWEDE